MKSGHARAATPRCTQVCLGCILKCKCIELWVQPLQANLFSKTRLSHLLDVSKWA